VQEALFLYQIYIKKVWPSWIQLYAYFSFNFLTSYKGDVSLEAARGTYCNILFLSFFLALSLVSVPLVPLVLALRWVRLCIPACLPSNRTYWDVRY